MDVPALLRLKGLLEASAEQPMGRPGEGHATTYPRVRAEVAAAIDPELREELDRLFPEALDTAGRPWGIQGDEAIVRMNQMAGWLGGMIEAAILDQRIQAEAAEKAKRTGFN